MKKLLVALGVFSLIASACGGDDAVDISDSPLAQAIAASLTEQGDSSPVSTQEEAECFAGRVVSELGESRLNSLGVTEDNVGDIDEIDFNGAELDTIVENLGECVDLASALAEEFEEDFGEEGAKCLADNLDNDIILDVMRAGFSDPDAEPSDEFFQAFLDVAAECDLPLN